MLSNLRAALGTAAFMILLAVGCRPDVRVEPAPLGESWQATTRAAHSSIDEDVRIDPSGRLVHAVTRARDDAGAEVRITFDPPSHTVVVEREDHRTTWTVPGDEPWILAPVRAPGGEESATPLVAWTTYRATRSTEWVRLVLPLEGKSYVVPRDQYVVDHTTVLVGDHAAEVVRDDTLASSIVIDGVVTRLEPDRRPGRSALHGSQSSL